MQRLIPAGREDACLIPARSATGAGARATRSSGARAVTRVGFVTWARATGLQTEADILALATRAELANRLRRRGLPRVEAASFVRDDLVPQMAGAEEVAAALTLDGTTSFSGLRPQRGGYERFVETPLPEVHVSFAATETFQQRNAGSSVEQGLENAARVVGRGHTRTAARDGDDRHRRSAVRSRARWTRVTSSTSPPARRPPARTRSSLPTRSASACPARRALS